MKKTFIILISYTLFLLSFIARVNLRKLSFIEINNIRIKIPIIPIPP